MAIVNSSHLSINFFFWGEQAGRPGYIIGRVTLYNTNAQLRLRKMACFKVQK